MKILTGILCLLAAALLFLAPRWSSQLYPMPDYMDYMSSNLDHYVALSSFVAFMNLLDFWIFFSLSGVCLVTGFALLTDRGDARKAAVTTVVLLSIGTLHLMIMLALSRWAPGGLLKLVCSEKYCGNEYVSLIRGETELSGRYLKMLLPMLAATVLFGFCTHRISRSRRKLDRGVAGLLVFLPCLCVTLILARNLQSSFTNFYGRIAAVSSSLASTAVSDAGFPHIEFAGILLITAASMLLRKAKYKYVILGLAAAVILGGIVIAMRVELDDSFPDFDAYQEHALLALDMQLLSGTALFLGISFWIAAASRDAIPLWAQILVAILSFWVFFVLEYVKTNVLAFPFWIPLGHAGLTMVLCAVALPLGLLQTRTRKVHTMF